MKAKTNKNKGFKVKNNPPVYEQMKRCFRDMNLPVRGEEFNGQEFSFHSVLYVTDVRSVVYAFYNIDTGLLRLYALHHELTEHEWVSTLFLLDIIKHQFEVSEKCLAYNDMAIGCMVNMHDKAVGKDFVHFKKMLNEILNINDSISKFLCGQRDLTDGTIGRRVIIEMKK